MRSCGTLVLAQHHHHPGPFAGHAVHGIAERPPGVAALRVHQVPQRVLDMDPDEGRFVRIDLAHDEGEMDRAVDHVAVADHPELAERGRQAALPDPVHRLLVQHAVLDEVRDGADLELVVAREHVEVRPPGHGAVLVHDLDDDGGGLEAREPREVAGRLGVPGPRVSTPPAWARRGKMWPGWTKSSGRASRLAARCMVSARSWAEIPVPTPSAASIETVNIVRCGSVLCSTIGGTPIWSHRSAVIGRQMRPRA